MGTKASSEAADAPSREQAAVSLCCPPTAGAIVHNTSAVSVILWLVYCPSAKAVDMCCKAQWLLPWLCGYDDSSSWHHIPLPSSLMGEAKVLGSVARCIPLERGFSQPHPLLTCFLDFDLSNGHNTPYIRSEHTFTLNVWLQW